MSDQQKGPGVVLTEEEKKMLLKLVRQSILKKLDPKKADDVKVDPRMSVLNEQRGLFVTLHKGGALRGCVGHILPTAPLLEEVQKVAELAAFEDPRFPQVTLKELPDLHIEITIMSPMYTIDNPEDVVPGKHGLIIRRGYYQGLLLPQVASERNWDRETFLDQTCIKAGLRPGDWRKDGTEIQIFTAYIFAE